MIKVGSIVRIPGFCAANTSRLWKVVALDDQFTWPGNYCFVVPFDCSCAGLTIHESWLIEATDHEIKLIENGNAI